MRTCGRALNLSSQIFMATAMDMVTDIGQYAKHIGLYLFFYVLVIQIINIGGKNGAEKR